MIKYCLIGLAVFCLAVHPFRIGKSDDVSCKKNNVLKTLIANVNLFKRSMYSFGHNTCIYMFSFRHKAIGIVHMYLRQI